MVNARVGEPLSFQASIIHHMPIRDMAEQTLNAENLVGSRQVFLDL